MVLRGYNREQVDTVVRRVLSALESRDPAVRAAAKDLALRPQLSVNLRGYHRMEVDAALQRLAAELG